MEQDLYHVACCAVCLPIGSALMAKLVPEYSLALRDFPVQALFKRDGGEEILEETGDGLELDDFKAWLGKEWKEVGNGRIIG